MIFALFGIARSVNLFARAAVIKAIRIYSRVLSPLLGSNCRYYPTCSAYMMGSIEQKGLVLGILKGLYRILRCNPFSPGGYDPVDPKDRARLDD